MFFEARLFFEVNPSTNVKVWQYRSPITGAGIVDRDFETDDPDFVNDILFRAKKYSPDYSAFDGRILIPMELIEGEPWTPCDLVTSLIDETQESLSVYPNPVTEVVIIEHNDKQRFLEVKIFSIYGQLILNTAGFGKLEIDMRELNRGFFYITVNKRSYKLLKID